MSHRRPPACPRAAVDHAVYSIDPDRNSYPDALRHDPLFAVLAEAADLSAALAGKSTLNRLELSGATIAEAERYKKIAVDHAAVDRDLGLLVARAARGGR